MLAKLIGQVDVNSAAVLVAMFLTACIVITTMISKRRSRLDLDHEFELGQQKQRDARDRSMFDAETERGYKFKQIEEKLLTSHRVVEGKQEN